MPMKKYLVKKGYITRGGTDFHKDMKRWQTFPITLDSGVLEKREILIEGPSGVRRPWRRWLINTEDLIPFKTVLENK